MPKPEEKTSIVKRRNLVKLFNNTSVIPFEWRKYYQCFYCKETFQIHSKFVKHTKSHEKCKIDHQSLLSLKQDVDLKLDVSKIICELCEISCPNLNAIIDHLIQKHQITYCKQVNIDAACYNLKTLKCLDCSKKFDLFPQLETHMQNDHNETVLVCKSCGHSFSKSKDLASHIKEFHGKGFICIKCSLCFENITALREHNKEQPEKVRCEICPLSFTSVCVKQKHVNAEHANVMPLERVVMEREKNIKDKEVAKEEAKHAREDLARRKDLANRKRQNIACIFNMTTATPFKFFRCRFICFFCKEEYEDHEDLRRHTLTQHPHFELKPGTLPKILRCVNMKIKLDVTSITCRLCSQPFPDLNSVIDHLMSTHDVKYDKSLDDMLQPFILQKHNMVCQTCGESFAYFGKLLEHINDKHSGKTHLCPHCGYTFASRLILKSHMTRIHGLKDLKCKECGLELTSVKKLNFHRAKVHGIKEAKCKLCSEKFASIFEMLKHKLQAHNIGHKCVHCNRMFVRDSFLRLHVRRIHIKERNVPCPECDLKFFDSTLLRIHMVKHTGERNYHCDICGKSFFWKKNLQAHLASHHKKASYSGDI